MNRRTLAGFASALVLLAGASGVSAQTVDELVAKNIIAKGGLEKLQAVQTVKQTSRLTMQGSVATVTVYGKRPNLVRQEIKLGDKTIIHAFDGTTPWIINPLTGASTPMIVTGPQADVTRELSNFDSPLMYYKTRGYRVDLVGLETLGDRKVHHLKMVDKRNQTQHLYLDAETGLEAKLVVDTESGPMAQEMSDYRDVEGIKVPFLVKTSMNGVAQSEIRLDKVEFNVKIDDALFKIAR
jgi:outer membrane lipoprotein-sorting protein